MCFIAYSLKKKVNKNDFESAAIELIQFEGHRRGQRERMFRDVYMWQLQHREEPKNLLVITENIEDNDFVAALLHLRNLDNNILLALAQSPSLLLKHLASCGSTFAPYTSSRRMMLRSYTRSLRE